MSASPLWLPPAIQRERENHLPSGELELSDGRKLKPTQVKNQPFQAWRAPDNLVVMADVIQTAKHGPLRHVVLGYASRRPNWDDVRKVREVFFGDKDCFIPMGTSDDAEDHLVHLWSMPPTWSK